MISEERVKTLNELVMSNDAHKNLLKERLKLWCFVDINDDAFKHKSVQEYYRSLGFSKVKVEWYNFMKDNELAVYVPYIENI